MARKAAATVRRPEANKVPYTKVLIWLKVGRVNPSANGCSRRSESGERDIQVPPVIKFPQPLAMSRHSSPLYHHRVNAVSLSKASLPSHLASGIRQGSHVRRQSTVARQGLLL